MSTETMDEISARNMRSDSGSLGEVEVPADKLWGSQTRRSLENFNIGKGLIPREMIAAYATSKKAPVHANYAGKRLDSQRHKSIVEVCDDDTFPWA